MANARAFEDWTNSLATMPNGQPAWPVAKANGIPFDEFRLRLERGWTASKAAREPFYQEPDPICFQEAEALANGVSIRTYWSRINYGLPHEKAVLLGCGFPIRVAA